MAILGLDHFTDISGTKLIDHVPNIGNAWIRALGGVPPPTIIISNDGSISQLVYDLDEASDAGSMYYVNIASFSDGYIQALYKDVSPRSASLVARYFLDLDLEEEGGIFLNPFPGVPYTKWLFESDLDTTLIDFSFVPGTIARIEVVGTVATALFNGVPYAQINTNLAAGRWGIEVRVIPV